MRPLSFLSSTLFFSLLLLFFFFNDTATTEIYTLSLHDAAPAARPGNAGHPTRSGRTGARDGRPLVSARTRGRIGDVARPTRLYRDAPGGADADARAGGKDRKSTRLNSSHGYISYAVFCL